MAIIISLCNQKGGVAKTTSTYNLATLSALKGYKTLMVDFDPQASLTISVGLEPLDYENNISSLIERTINKEKNIDFSSYIYSINSINNLYIIPSMIDLATKEKMLYTITSREIILKKILKEIGNFFDFIFIDCPPTLGNLTINALSASDYLIVPTTADYLSYRGFNDLLETVEELTELTNENLKLLGVLITCFDGRVKDEKQILEIINKNYKLLGVIKKSVSIRQGIYAGLPITLEPKNKISNQIANEYKKTFSIIETLKEEK